MAKRFFLMLAHPFKPTKHGIGGWLLSEKLDGMRCFWDGGVTRGMPKKEIPWANTDKDERLLKIEVSTGLWSRYGNVIHAPNWWLDHLPRIPLDGELFTMREDRQNLMSIVKDVEPGLGWSKVKYHCFDSPPPEIIFVNGHVGSRDKNFDKVFNDCVKWFDEHAYDLKWQASVNTVFRSTVSILERELEGNRIAIPHPQHELPYGPEAYEHVDIYLEEYTRERAEGLILRDPDSRWIPERTHQMVKIKKYQDDEATVVGYTTGRLTDRGSKLLGMMGALVLNYQDKRLELSGFTEKERELGPSPEAEEWAIANPGVEVPEWIQAVHFPRGKEITFIYRDKSRDGIPQEARFWRESQTG